MAGRPSSAWAGGSSSASRNVGRRTGRPHPPPCSGAPCGPWVRLLSKVDFSFYFKISFGVYKLTKLFLLQKFC